MQASPIAILGRGLVSAVGLTYTATCTAIRAKACNPTPTHFIDADGEWILANQVCLDRPWYGLAKLKRMVAMALDEALSDAPGDVRAATPLLLCLAESERPGRMDGLDDSLLRALQDALQIGICRESCTVPQGRVGTAVALEKARRLIHDDGHPYVVIASADSLLHWPTLSDFQRRDRLLSDSNSNGIVAGEGAGALLLGKPPPIPSLLCLGVGMATEKASITSEEPLKGTGLVSAIRAALEDADCRVDDLEARMTDLAGEHFFFKEAALAIAKTMRVRKSHLDIMHPAECTGETGAVIGSTMMALAEFEYAKGYASGPRLLHFANDAGERAALIVGWSSNR